MPPSSSCVQLTVAEQMFIAKLRSYGMLSMEDARILHDACFDYERGLGSERSVQLPKLDDTIKKCSAVLRDFGYSVIKVFGEETGRSFVAHARIVNRPWDEDMATAEQKKDYKYFDKIAERIMDSPPAYRIGEMEALQSAASAETDMGRGKMLLREWTDKGYLEFVNDYYSLGPVAIHLYETKILETLPNLPKCALCNKILLRGYSCEHCPVKLHKRCFKSLFDLAKATNPKIRCSGCRNPYPDFGEMERLAALAVAGPYADEESESLGETGRGDEESSENEDGSGAGSGSESES